MNIFYILLSEYYSGIFLDEFNFEKAKKFGAVKEEKTFEDVDLLEMHLTNQLGKQIEKYYAVKNGGIKGVFFSWDTCENLVNGYENAKYKSFKNVREAICFCKGVDLPPESQNIQYVTYSPQLKQEACGTLQTNETVTKKGKSAFAYVDGSFNASKRVYGYGVILNVNGKNYTFSGSGHDSDMVNMRNVGGEIEGAMRAIKEAIALGVSQLEICYDYLGIEKWATGEWNRNRKGTKRYYRFVQEASKRIKIKFKKVKAHSNVELNEKVDRMAKTAVGIR